MRSYRRRWSKTCSARIGGAVTALVGAPPSPIRMRANWDFSYNERSYLAKRAVLLQPSCRAELRSILDEHVFDHTFRHEPPELRGEPSSMRTERL